MLDYGNGRMQMLDPENDYAFVSEFAINPDVRTENTQFAIGLNGNIYLDDGLGGGTAYDADGNYLGAFALPEPMPGDEPGAKSHIFTDASGGVYVFDWTGNHHYQELSIVPEPSAISLLAGASALAFALTRRRFRKE